MILCAGEILADMIGSVRDGGFVYESKAGGAPFNVACASGPASALPEASAMILSGHFWKNLRNAGDWMA